MMARVDDDVTLKEARETLREEWKGDGGSCPCCGQFVKLYPRNISGASAVILIRLYHIAKPWLGGHMEMVPYTHVQRDLIDKGLTPSSSGDYAKLRHWDLIEEHPRNPVAERPAKKSAGLWRITEKGIRFVCGQCRVPKYAHTYDNRLYSTSGEHVDIVACLGKRFHYGELMRGA